MNHLVKENSVHWHGHVLKRKDCHVLRKAFDFEAEDQRKKGKSKEHERSRMRKQVKEA